ncbi:hypothetical protein [Microbacterium sp. Marseille-Q6965]|uniref:hypothetical protein n=1 Tax=Microbacterium sp. Marseille-Q6965 TaxID=2965072 RepID=UPI0021B7DBB2|nr:hypothetical protein [Microbacterium sp. Marseille-Q6965]
MTGGEGSRHVAARRLAGWAVATVGVLWTLFSIAPSLTLVAGGAVGGSAGFPLMLLGIAALELAVPVLLGLAVANAARRWWLWLACAALAVIAVWSAAPALGTLGVFWGPR